ncbi:hypothetical protein SAMN05216188_11775 [Lentzea xinjiangensis]|uniref:Uncharacterized protein n=1 Tax=Lentzea xinjiangensis TaxID=402600 RepID=A0A1H9SZK9_9PSEU|nr:hypothetical protein SAMN05216188_11775 [Lentzea xinjiangensis]
MAPRPARPWVPGRAGRLGPVGLGWGWRLPVVRLPVRDVRLVVRPRVAQGLVGRDVLPVARLWVGLRPVGRLVRDGCLPVARPRVWRGAGLSVVRP